MTARAEAQQRIAREHGMSFEAVLRGYATDGYGIDTTAKIIGYNVAAFRKLLKRHGNFGIKWPTLQQQIAAGTYNPAGGEATRAKRAAALRSYHEQRVNAGRAHPNQWTVRSGDRPNPD